MRPAMPIAADLARFAAQVRFDGIPAEVRTRAKYLMLDALGCGLAARRFDFAAPAPRDPQTLALAAKVDYAVDARSTFPKHYCGEIVVRARDGREWRHREAAHRGGAERPLTASDIEAKFAENAAFGGAADGGRRLREAVLHLEDISARTLEDPLAA